MKEKNWTHAYSWEGLHQAHTLQIGWKYREYEQKILSQLADALILNNMKMGNTGKKKKTEIPPLRFNQNWEIDIPDGKQENKKGPVDVLWDIQSIHIGKLRSDIRMMLDNAPDMLNQHKDRYLIAVDSFIKEQFINARKSLEKKDHLLHKNFRLFYEQLAYQQENMTEAEKKLYRDICLVFANKLYGINKNYLDKTTWEINQDGLTYIAKVFLRAINNIPSSGSSKAFHKVFHDGDFNFLRKQSSNGNPQVGTLDHYVKAVMYLMDSQSFNAYGEDGVKWAKEWSKSKKTLLNTIFVSSQVQEEEKKSEPNTAKEKLHKDFADKWRESVETVSKDQNRESTDRLKTESSKMLKIWWRSKTIDDESGLRVIYYEDPFHGQTKIAKHISEILKSYFWKIATAGNIKIESIQTDKKWEFISDNHVKNISNALTTMLKNFSVDVFDSEIKRRKKSVSSSSSLLEQVSQNYEELAEKSPTEGLKRAYQIANGEIKRGSNGDYKDFKLIVKYTIRPNSDDKENKQELSQEISFYPHTNDLNMGNHHFLDLEKKIFNRVKNMNDGELGKSISLNRLRYFTETAIKDIAFDIDCYDDKVARGVLPQPTNNAHQFLEIEGEKISLKDMIYRHQDNSERFDRIIAHVLNYFIKTNKLAYINKPNQNYFGLIKPEMLHEKESYKLRRFLTSDVLKQTALDARNLEHSISFYTEKNDALINPHFYTVQLAELGHFIRLEKEIN